MSVLELKSWFSLPLAFSFGSTDACLTKADGIKNKIINRFIYQIHIFHISNKFFEKNILLSCFIQFAHKYILTLGSKLWIERTGVELACCLHYNTTSIGSSMYPNLYKTRRRRNTVLRNTQIVLHSICYIFMKSNIWYHRFKPLYIWDLSRIWMITAVKKCYFVPQ